LAILRVWFWKIIIWQAWCKLHGPFGVVWWWRLPTSAVIGAHGPCDRIPPVFRYNVTTSVHKQMGSKPTRKGTASS
jgi:hypothetical protein